MSVMDPHTSGCSSPVKTDRAIEEFTKSFQSLLPDGSTSQSQLLPFIDVQHACDELLKLPFHSEDGKLQVIEKLTKLEGNFVVKIIRKGLVSLNKVYHDSKTFEEESLELVDVCCLQLHGLQTGHDNQRLFASPADVIDWTMELCDELLTNESAQSIISISSSVSKIKDLYESIRRWGVIEETSIYEEVFPNIEVITFAKIKNVLKKRIHSVGFVDVIEQTTAIIMTDKPKGPICKPVLSKWLKLLKISSVTNRFAAQVAKHDTLVHSEHPGPDAPCDINGKSFICQVFDAINSLMKSNDKYECVCDQEKMVVLFAFPELFQLHPKTCIKLIQSREVCAKAIEDVFSILAINMNKDIVPSLDPNLEETARKLKLLEEGLLLVKHHGYLTLSFNAVTQALLTVPDLKQHVLNVLQVWKDNFPDDSSHRMLTELFVMVIEVIEMKKESGIAVADIDMEQLVIFLTELSIEHRNALHLWRKVLPSLVDAFPNSWYRPENLNPMRMHVNRIEQFDNHDYSVHHVACFLSLLKSKSLPEKVKTTVSQIGLDLLGQVLPNRHNWSDSIFYLILWLLPVMDIAQVRQYSLQLLNIAKGHHSSLPDFNSIIGIIVAVRKSCHIERKKEVLEYFLRLLNEANRSNRSGMLSACNNFLQFSVNTENTRRFFALAAAGAHNSYWLILTCLQRNRGILNDHETVNNHIDFLFQIISEKLNSNANHLVLMDVILTNMHRYNREFRYPSIAIFETLVTTVAHDISVGAFDKHLNEAALKVTIAAVDSHQQDPPIDFQSLNVDLNRVFRESKHFAEHQCLGYNILEGLCLLAKLPFTLEQIKSLIQNLVATTNDKEFRNVLFKICQMSGNGPLSSLDHDDLYSTLQRSLDASTVSSAHSLSLRYDDYFTVPNYNSIITIEQALTSMERPSESKNHLAAMKKVTQPSSANPSITPKVVEYEVFETDSKDEGRDIEKMLFGVPSSLTHLIGNCLTECYQAGFNDQPSMKTLAEEALNNTGNWRKLEIHIENLAHNVSYVSQDAEKLGPFLSDKMKLCYILGLREKPSPKIAILFILKGFSQCKKLQTEIIDIEKEVFNVAPNLVEYISACAEECRARNDSGEEPRVKSLTLQILKSFEFCKRLEIEIEQMKNEISPFVPEFIPSIAECMRQCFIVGLGETPATKTFVLQMFEINDGWKQLQSKIREDKETASSISELISLLMACMKHWQVFGLSEDGRRVKDFIVLIIEAMQMFTWNSDDISKVTTSCLNIPKQLYLIFKEARDNEEAKQRLVSAFNVIRRLDSSIHTTEGQRRESFLQLDFYLVLKESSAEPADLCSALLISKGLDYRYLSAFLPIREDDYDIFDTFEPYDEILHPIEEDKSEFPSPGYVVYLVINQLRRLGISDIDLQEKTRDFCNKLLCYVFQDRSHYFSCECRTTIPFNNEHDRDDKLRFVFKLMNESSYLADVEYWLSKPEPHHHVLHCNNDIIAALSWKKRHKSCEEAMRMNEEVYATLFKLQEIYTKEHHDTRVVSCYAWMSERIEIIARVLETIENEDIVVQLFYLLCKCKSATVVESCLDTIPSWNKRESLSLVEGLTNLYENRSKEMIQRELENELEVALKILPFAARKFPNSASKAISFLETIIEKNYGHADKMNLKRLVEWSVQMNGTGYDQQAIKAWCTCLVHLPNLSSRDVDAIAIMTPKNIKILNDGDADEVGKCLFPTNVIETEECFKRRLMLARLLSELVLISVKLKDNLYAVQRIKETVKSLCLSFTGDPKTVSVLYRDRDILFKKLFIFLFGGENGKCAESLNALANQRPLSKSFIVLIRRLARCLDFKPTTFKYAKNIVHAILEYTAKFPKWQYREIQNVIHMKVLHFEPNQDAIHTLQVVGYNQSVSEGEDLWYSSSIQMPAYVPTVESFEASRMETMLRQLWREWKQMLPSSISIDGKSIQISEFFKPTDSLEEIESQLEAVKRERNLVKFRQLLYKEKKMRHKIKEQGIEVKKMATKNLGKLVIVWENAFLECIKICSEKIPDCYAPNGFHSEKPVICGIAVDNRILTLYKQDKGGTRTELENVEVKLYPAGMVVFGAFCGTHPYDTEQLWAAFYKMFLDKRLVPKIFITNVSPAFDWIKHFVASETTPPDCTNLFNCCHLIPACEDSFDYSPVDEIPVFNKRCNPEIQELIILTPEKTKFVETHRIKPPNRNQLIREKIENVVLYLQSRLQEMHPKSHDKILDRVKFAIRQEVEAAVDGGQTTQESISSNIDMTRLLYQCQDAHQYSKDEYCDVILDAVNTVTGELRGTKTSYDGCQYVVFYQPNENCLY